MIKRILSILFLCITLLMCSCFSSNNSLNTEGNENNNDVQPMNSMNFDEKYQFYSERYPNKNILVWVTDLGSPYELELNDYLYENNYDYIICFKTSLEGIEDESGNFISTNAEFVSKIIQNGEQIDILDSLALINGMDVISNSYYNFINCSYFEPLDDYLKDEKYQDIIKSMPQKYWDSYKYNGKIYGVDNSFSSLYYDNGYKISNEIFEKSDLTTDDFQKPLSEIEPTIKEVFEKTKKRMNFNFCYFTSDFFPASYITEGIGIVGNKLVNIFEQNETKNYYKLLTSLESKGYAAIDSAVIDSTGIELTQASAAYGEIIKNNRWDKTNVFYKQNNYIHEPYKATGIYSGSKNKEQAFDLLMNVFYNEDFNNIITYGIKGKQYEIEDGKVKMKLDESNPYSQQYDIKCSVCIWYNNPMISLPCDESDTVIQKLDYYKAYENAEFLDGFGFFFDGTSIKDTYLKVMDTVESLKISGKDIDSYMKEFNKKLYDAGLQEVLDEANRQLEEYHNKNN